MSPGRLEWGYATFRTIGSSIYMYSTCIRDGISPLKRPSTHPAPPAPLSALDFHVLLVLAAKDLYGYGIKKAVEGQSEGLISPEIGSLYRVLARLIDAGWIQEVSASPSSEANHPGRARRYYGLTAGGLAVLEQEMRRLRQAVDLAENILPGRAP